MPITLIEQLPTFNKKVEGDNKIAISEMFVDTIQGEGINAGAPATFIRMQGCTLACTWCDTLDVWPHGNEYTFNEVLDLLAPYSHKYKNGNQHIILTGGSPLKQQDQLAEFFNLFAHRFGFKPYVEVENEVVLRPAPWFYRWISCWNNSPKLSNSGMKRRLRVKPEILKYMSNFPNSWFKFVVDCEEDWQEIIDDFLPHINKEQIILMPQGQTQEELTKVREAVVDMAIRYQVRYMDRLHVVLWNRKTGV